VKNAHKWLIRQVFLIPFYYPVVSTSMIHFVRFNLLLSTFFYLLLFVNRQDITDMKCLSSDEVKVVLQTVPDWTYVPNSETGDAIKRSYAFPDFQTAFLFMAGSAQLAEKNQHHPDWHNLWNTVDVTLTTDDKLCLSTFDIELAQGMDLLFNNTKA
jgi:4a-hydroxytetrahydrobiopterin dehydratase